MEEKYNNLKRGERGAIISIVAYLCLSVLKVVVGVISQSSALLADGMNNLTDIVASVAVLVGLRFAQKPADGDHRYGHWKSETIASMVASFIMVTVGIQVVLQSAWAVLEEQKTSPDLMAAYVGFFSAVVMYGVYRYNKGLAKQINSKALMAAAKDNRSDAYVSVGATIGIIASQFGWAWVDTVTAFVVGMLIIRTAWGIFRESSHELSDGFDEQKIVLYAKHIAKESGVQSVLELRGRTYGSNEIIDVVITVDAKLSIEKAHDIATSVESKLMEECGVYEVHVHVEPEGCKIHKRDGIKKSH